MYIKYAFSIYFILLLILLSKYPNCINLNDLCKDDNITKDNINILYKRIIILFLIIVILSFVSYYPILLFVYFNKNKK